MSTEKFQENLPPSLLELAQSLPAVSSNKAAPATPSITSFKPDTGVVGDKITSASALTLNGTAAVGSTVTIFDGPIQIGTARANANGTWSFTITELSNADHNFTAKATDAAGNTSSASPPFDVKVDAATETSPPTAAPSGENPLVKGSLDSISTGKSEWAGFSRPHGFHDTVQAAAKRGYDLYVDAGSRPPTPTAPTTTVEVACSDPFVLFPLILGAIIKNRNRLRNNRILERRSASRDLTLKVEG
jgi:hypothetical protein